MDTVMDDTVLERALQDPEFAYVSAEAMGPSLWKAIHNITRVYVPTPEKMQALAAFMDSLAVLLPCSVCAQHFQALAPTLKVDSSLAALKWGIDVHNSVNKRLNKPVLSYKEAVRLIGSGGGSGATSSFNPAPALAAAPTKSATNTGLWAGLILSIVAALACVVGMVFVITRRQKAMTTVSRRNVSTFVSQPPA